MGEREFVEGVGEPVAHLAARLVDQNGADPDALVGHHAAGAALQVIPAPLRGVFRLQQLPALVGAAALRLRPDVEDRQDLEPGP